MTRPSQPRDQAALIAILGAVFLMAHMISGKAARDSLFLLNFPVEYLPRMTVAAAITSVFLVVLWARKLATRSPAELVPMALLASCASHLALWALYAFNPKFSSIAFYVYMIGPNAILLSSYWSLLNERFDPREAKRVFARVTAGGTLGGLLSGGLADVVADHYGPVSLFPMLAVLQFIAYLMVRRLASPTSAHTVERKPAPAASTTDFIAGFRYIRTNRYLFTLASLVFLVTMSAGLLDYVFKSGVAGVLGRGEQLVSFFALFYALSGLGTFLIQSLVAPYFFQRFGLTQSLLALPAAYFAGVAAKLAVPGLPGLVMLRGFESVIRGSIYRSGYEVCYTPVTNQEKRASKTIIDVGADRLGEATGGALLQGLLMTGMSTVPTAALVIGGGLSAVAGFLTYRMGKMYVNALETSLISRAREIESENDQLPNFNTESVIMGSLQDISLSGNSQESMLARLMGSTGAAHAQEAAAELGEADATLRRAKAPHGGANNPLQFGGSSNQVYEAAWSATRADQAGINPAPTAAARNNDPAITRLEILRSGDLHRVLMELHSKQPLDALHIPAVIQLLAWDDVAEAAIRALRLANDPIEGQLADAMLRRDGDFAVRRRVPRVLATRPSQLTVEALLQGLRDQRFEVRFRCGKALASVTKADGGLIIEPGRIYRSIERECFVSKTVWSSYRLLEQIDDKDEDPYFDEILKDRTNKGLEHVFTLLALVLPREALQIAFKGLHTTDPHLRGTALEYLETILPDTIRERLWPLLESNIRERALHPSERRSRDQILADLRRSNQSIIVNLERKPSPETGSKSSGD